VIQLPNCTTHHGCRCREYVMERLPHLVAAAEALDRLVFMSLRDDFPDGGDIILRWDGNRADWEAAQDALAQLKGTLVR